MRLEGKVAIVTGGARGIGRGIAKRFAKEGAQVVVNDINDEGGQRTVEEIRKEGGKAIYCHADVSDEGEVNGMMETTVKTFGKLNILVCNAVCATEDILRDNLEANLRVNVQGTYLCCIHAIPYMKAAGGGSIITVSSVNALLGMQGIHAYSASKAAIIGLTRSIAVWHGRDNIRANIICPGTIQTEIWEPILRQRPQIWEELVAWYPIGRLGTVEDVANMALFLASDEASFVTGALFVVDGGLTAGLLEFGKLR